MRSQHRSKIPFALIVAASIVSLSPLCAGAEDTFAEQRRRNRERAEEERRNAQRREEESKRRIDAGKDQGERDLAEIDRYIREAQSSLSLANLKGKEWVEATSRDVPPEILELGRSVSARLAKIRRERADCGTALHSPTILISDTLRRISELDHAARAVAQEAKRLVSSVGSLYVGDVREDLRVMDERLAGAISIINWAKKGIQQLEAEELRAAKDYLQKDLEERKRAERRERRQGVQEGRSSSRRASSGLADAKERVRLRTFNSKEAKIQLEDSIRNLEFRHRKLVRRREEAGKKLSRNETTLGEDTEEIAVLKSDVDSFCQEVDDLAKLAEPYLGKAPGAKDDESEATDADDADHAVSAPEGPAAEPKPKTKSGSRFVYSWTPWEDSDSLSSERR